VANPFFVAKQFTLGKEERLKSRKQTELLFSEGKKFMIAPLRIHYSLSRSAQTSLLFGAGVSKRNFKKAVDRNRIKRLLRETYRLQKMVLQQQLEEQHCRLNLFIIYNGREIPDYHVLYEITGKVILKLCTITRELP